MGMEPSGTYLHKLAAQFVKHKRAGAPVCRPQTGRTELVLHKLGRPVGFRRMTLCLCPQVLQ